jgi:hypothetical protein
MGRYGSETCCAHKWLNRDCLSGSGNDDRLERYEITIDETQDNEELSTYDRLIVLEGFYNHNVNEIS